MSPLRRIVVLLLVSLTSAFGLAVAPARAAGTEAIKAADYIVSTFAGSKRFGDVGSAADSLLALAATGDAKYAADITAITTFLQSSAPAYVKADAGGVTGAAKLAIVAAAVKVDPASFGGVDLLAAVKAGIGGDGAFGAYPGPFSSGLGMLALARNGQPVPDAMVDYLLRYAEPRSGSAGGGFGCATYPFKAGGDCPAADPDSTAMAVLGLQASGSAKATQAATDALAWLQGTQQADGSWQNYSPVNSTGLVGPLFPAGSEQATKAAAYVASKQLPSGALTTGVDTKANLIATQQGIFALTGTTYATIGAGQPSPSASPSPAASPSASPSAEPGPATPSGQDPLVGWTTAALLVVVLAGFAVARRRAS